MSNVAVFLGGADVAVSASGAILGSGTVGDPLLVNPDGTTIAIAANALVVIRADLVAPDTTTAHTALLQAYDVNGTAYKTFATLTNADVPSCVLSQPSGGILGIVPPTADPHVIGAIWNNTGLIVISAG